MAVRTLTKEEIEHIHYGTSTKPIWDKTTDELYKRSLEILNDYKAETFELRPFKIDYAKAFGQQPAYPWVVVKLNNEKENEKMDAKKCDRCGKLFELKDAERWIDVPFAFSLDNRGDKEEIFKKYSEEYIKKEYLSNPIKFVTLKDFEASICPECRQAFANWWEMGATRTTKE